MLIIHGETVEPASYLYSKTINNKVFYYSGEMEEGVFIEEIVYNSIIKNNSFMANKFFQAIVTYNKNIYLCSFNDSSGTEIGESTVTYSTEEFKEDEIQEFLRDFIYVDVKDLWFLNISDGIYNFSKEEEVFELTESELEFEVMLSGFEKAKSFFKKIYIHIIVILLMFSAPIGFSFLDNIDYISSQDSEIIKLKNENRKLETEKKEVLKYITESSKRYKEIQNSKDIFEDKEKFNEFNSKF